MSKLFKKIIFFSIFILIISNNLALSKIKTEILFKINDSIVTNIDIENEKNFLLFLNPNLNNLSEQKIRNISIDSFKNRKIKEIELKKIYNLEDPNLGRAFIDNYLNNSQFKNKETLVNELNKVYLEYAFFENNFKIDNTWREYIYTKFKSKVKIDLEELKKQILNQDKEIEELNLSEIVFKNISDKPFNEYKKEIYSEIESSGFEVAASIYSISDTKKFGGKIGWVSSNQISRIIYSKIKPDTKITDPIETANGFLIIKINDRRKLTREVNFDEELEKLANEEMKNELNKLGYIYFNKIKKKTFISEK